MTPLKRFTRVYPLSKTLRFELKPIGKTLDHIVSSGLLEQDQHRAESYVEVKKIIDEYHKAFIESSLADFELQYYNEGKNNSLEEFYSYYMCRSKDETQKKLFEENQDKLRKQVADRLSKDERFKRIDKKELIEKDLIDFVKKPEERQLLDYTVVSAYQSKLTYEQFEKIKKEISLVLISKLNGSVEIGSLGKSRGLDLKCFFKVCNDIRKYKPDVVHAHIGAITYLLISSVFIRSCKYYVTIHSDARREAGNWFTRIIRRFLFKFNFVLPVTISPESRDSFLDFYKKAPELIFNGVPDAKVSLYETYDRLVFVHPASCQPVKNQRLLFSAFSEVAKKYPNIELHWYGSHSPYEILFNELNPFLGDHIIYKGIVEKSGFVSILSKLLKPLIRFLFGKQPDEINNQIALNLSANIFLCVGDFSKYFILYFLLCINLS